jgi:hypothetical protein
VILRRIGVASGNTFFARLQLLELGGIRADSIVLHGQIRTPVVESQKHFIVTGMNWKKGAWVGFQPAGNKLKLLLLNVLVEARVGIG